MQISAYEEVGTDGGSGDAMNAASSTDPRTQAPVGTAEAEGAVEVAGEQVAGEQEVVGQEAVEQSDDAQNATTTGSLR